MDEVILDLTPTGAFGLPRWKYDLRLAAACLEADPPLTPAFRKHVAELLGKCETTIDRIKDQSHGGADNGRS